MVDKVLLTNRLDHLKVNYVPLPPRYTVVRPAIHSILMWEAAFHGIVSIPHTSYLLERLATMVLHSLVPRPYMGE